MNVTYDKSSLIVDGKRVFVRSGAFHYFRTPGVDAAKDRFMKLKAAGYNTVDIYLNANYHSVAEGEFDFSGVKDVRAVLQVAKDIGLFVIARPGPFINAEVNAGGLPFWLLKKENVVPRNRVGSQYNYSPEYMAFVTDWYDQVIPILNNFDNIIAFQIENEYATDEMDEQYLKELYDMARARGIKCPIFHNDAYNAGLWADVVDIYASDIYPYINSNQNWKQDHFCFDTVDNLEDMVRAVKEDAPIFIAEMQGGWFDKWDGIGYSAMREALGDEHINIMTKTAISQGCTMFNHYMAVGGTSWGDLACDEVYTSYEFTAGIDEYGSIHPNFYRAKAINYFLDSFGLTNTYERENLDLGENIYAVRRKDQENSCGWLFVRNLNPDSVTLSVNNNSFNIKAYDMKIMPENLQLNACKVKFSDAEFFARLKNDEEEVVFVIIDENSNMFLDINGETVVISCNRNNYDNFKYEQHGKTTTLVFITQELANKTWIVDDKVIFNADFVYSNGRIALSKTTEIAYYDLKHGFSKKYFKFQEESKVVELQDFDINFCAPEIDLDYSYGDWKKIEGKTDSLSVGVFDEFIWYKAQLPKLVKEITLSARHLFSLYINGKEILSRNSYKYEKLQQVEETISVKLDETILTKEQNELTILVQNLGFDKGFSGETNNPRGLVDFKVEPHCDIQFSVNGKLATERGECLESENPYFAKLSVDFDIEFKENVVFAKYIQFKDFIYDRATIFLNGVKIGRYLKNNKEVSLQDKFYLINAFLKPKNKLEIVVWNNEAHRNSEWDFKNELRHVIILLGDENLHQLY